MAKKPNNQPTTVAKPVLWLQRPEPMPEGWRLLPDGDNFVRLVSRKPYVNVEMAPNVGGKPDEAQAFELPEEIGDHAKAMADLRKVFGVNLEAA